MRQKISDTRPLLEQIEIDRINVACLAKIGEAAFRSAQEDGKQMWLDEALTFAVGN